MLSATLSLLGVLFACAPSNARAEPSAEQVLQVCSRAIAKDFKGVDAAMCDWYVTPCPCNFKQEASAGEWCLPPKVDSLTVATQVVEILAHQPERLSLPASTPVIQALRTLYPCE